MKICFVYVSCLKDLHWLSYSLQFLKRNWREYGTEIVVRVEPDCMDVVKSWGVPGVQYREIGSWGNGYHLQLYQKLIADQHTDADLIILIDSDLMLFAPCWLDDLLFKDQIIVEYLPWAACPEAERYWRSNSSAAIGFDIPYDVMVRPPFPIWRSTFAAVRAQIEKTTGKSLKEFMYSDEPFSVKDFASHRFPLADYECLNAYGLKHEPDKYVATDARARNGAWKFRLYWSHGDWSEETEADLKRRLSI